MTSCHEASVTQPTRSLFVAIVTAAQALCRALAPGCIYEFRSFDVKGCMQSYWSVSCVAAEKEERQSFW